MVNSWWLHAVNPTSTCYPDCMDRDLWLIWPNIQTKTIVLCWREDTEWHYVAGMWSQFRRLGLDPTQGLVSNNLANVLVSGLNVLVLAIRVSCTSHNFCYNQATTILQKTEQMHNTLAYVVRRPCLHSEIKPRSYVANTNQCYDGHLCACTNTFFIAYQ
jgi:hypothetical protein